MTPYIGTISFAVGAAAFLFLSLLLILSWRGRLQGILLTAGAVTSALWLASLAYATWSGRPTGDWSQALEVLRGIAWFAFLGSLLAFPAVDGVSKARRARLVGGLIAFFCVLLLASAFKFDDAQANESLFGIIAFSRVVFAIFGLALTEAVFRNAHAEQRWTLKYLCLGLGAMFGYDFYLYSDAMLFRHVDPDVWVARGAANALVVPLLAMSAARNPSWSLDVAISRRILFHSTTLLGAGIYLLLTAAAGYYLRFFGGSWGRVFQATFLFASMVALIALLISRTLRGRLKVFLSKNFFTYKYDYREEWLKFTETLSGGQPGERLLERSIQAVGELVESAGGALWLQRGRDSFEFAGAWNLPDIANASEPAHSSFAKLLSQRQWVLNLEDVSGEGGLGAEVARPAWLEQIPRAWLVVPLIQHEKLIGFMVLTESKADLVFNWEVSDLLKTAGRQVASYLAHMEATKALTVARQFESFTRTTTFVVHDLKNLVAQLSLLLNNAQRHKQNPAFVDDMLETVENAQQKMQRLLTQLRSGSPQSEVSLAVDLAALLERIIASYAHAVPRPRLVVGEPRVSVRADSERLERVLGHLVQNAIEATPADGQVNVSTRLSEDQALIEVSDTGRGMSREFVLEQLFQPFETTKQSGMGVGAYEAREYVRELGGQIEVDSELGKGTRIRVKLPILSRHLLGEASSAALEFK